MDNYIEILKEVDFNTSTWSGGTTTELFIYPKGSKYSERDFKVRISTATVELDQSDFTKLNGVNRFIAPLDNNLKLTHNGLEAVNLKPFEVHEFPGHIDTTSYSKARDFNLMLADGTKGKLKSFYIKEKTEVIILADYGFNLLYSFDNPFKISIDGGDFTLHPNELLVIKSNTAKDIKIYSDNSAYILLSSFVL